jgi:4-oxalocrotonate tautomerase
MPLARIDLMRGKTNEYRQAIGNAVYDALRSIGVPEDDRFQIITEHESANFLFAKSYLGIEHTSDLVMIQITFNEGRTTDQKKTLFKAIADGIHDATGLRTADVFVSLVEVKRENWSFGDGAAQYALA